MRICIRKATADDLNIFVNFTIELSKFNRSKHSIECKYDDYELVLNSIREKAKKTFNSNSKDVLILIAEIEDTPVGYALGRVFEEEKTADNGTGKMGLLDELYVDDKARGLGIGKKLMDKVTEWMREKGISRVKLHTYSWNNSAKKLYEKCGFSQYALSYEKFMYNSEDNQFPILETERLILRALSEEDATTLFKYWSDDEVTSYMNIDAFTDLSQARNMINLLNSLLKEKQAIRWGIYSKELACLIGTCGYNSGLKQETYIGEIGYELGRQHWGKGYMAEALEPILEYGFNILDLNRIEAYVMLENTKSASLLERLGFQKEGILRERGYYKNGFWDEYIFSLLKKDRL